MIHILPATTQQSLALARLARETFVDAFGKDNDKVNLNEYVTQAFSDSTIRQELTDPAADFYLAYEGEAPLGYLKLRKGEGPDQLRGQCVLELQRIYVHQHAIGRGIGAQLMKTAITSARQQNADTLWLGVWEHNPTAITFYQKWGFSIFGSHLFHMGHDPQTDLLMQAMIHPSVTYHPAGQPDLPAICQLLVDQQLPVDDLSGNISFFVARDDAGELVATGGVEHYGKCGLLRSVAVRADQQGRGIGQQLVKYVEQAAMARGTEDLFLLTTTAPEFFRRWGFASVDRAAVPEEIRSTTEFSSVCPASAVCLHKRLV